MRRFLAGLATAGLLVGLIASAAVAAPGGVARNQVTTNVYTMYIGYNHTYNVVINPCNGGTVEASGWQWGADGNPLTHNPDETITATLTGGGTTITFNPAVYVGGWGGSAYSWSGTFPVAGGTFDITEHPSDFVYHGVQITLDSSIVSSWTNHGDYVSSQGGGADAAHSCIGMPIVAQ